MRYDRLTTYLSMAILLLFVATLTYFYIVSGGSFLPAWLTILGLSVGLFIAMSIPKYVIVSPQSVEIHCVMELTQIKLANIERIKLLSKKEMRYSVPLCGIVGLFGYFGYYVDLRKMRIFKIYARKWDNFVLIDDCFNNRHIFSIENPEEFIKLIDSKIKSNKKRR